MKKKRVAFSLVELMFFTVLVSVLLAAFMPVVSKKIVAESPAKKIEGALKVNCPGMGPYCTVCHRKKCMVCELECPSGKTLDYQACLCK